MREIGCVSITPEAAQLKDKQNDLRAEITKLLSEYAETCEALGHWYQQKGYEAAAKTEFDRARNARQWQISDSPIYQT